MTTLSIGPDRGYFTYKKESPMKLRSKYDIFASILEISKIPIRKTRLMQSSNNSPSQIEKFLPTLMDNGLISRCDSYYSITERGRYYLSKYYELLECLT